MSIINAEVETLAIRDYVVPAMQWQLQIQPRFLWPYQLMEIIKDYLHNKLLVKCIMVDAKVDICPRHFSI